MDAHHSIGNSHVLFMIWGSSQVSFPVMLYPFSMMCQQYNQGPVPRHMSWSFASLMAHTPQWRSILLLKLLAHLCSLGLDRQASHASTSRPPQQSHCLLEWIHLCYRVSVTFFSILLLTYRLFGDNPLLKNCHLHSLGWPLVFPLEWSSSPK